jgi:hypothetical protein
MARGACNFRQRDLTAAIKAAREAGLPLARVEVREGLISLIAKSECEASNGANEQGRNEWDDALGTTGRNS